MKIVLSNLVNNAQPNMRRVTNDYQAKSGEMILSEGQWESKSPDAVWDANTLTLREKTPQEIEAEKFEAAKTDKVVEFFIRALQDVLVTVPEAEGTYDRVPTELLLKALVAHFLVQAEKEVGSPQKWGQMLQILGKLRTKRAYVGSMTLANATSAEVKAQSWDT